MSPVGSPGMSWIFAESQKSTTPRTPSGPRLAPQAAGPSTRPGVAGDTFPRRDTLHGSANGRREVIQESQPSRHHGRPTDIIHNTLAIVYFFSLISSLTFCLPVLSLPAEWERYRLFACPLPMNHDRVGKESLHIVSTHLCDCTESNEYPPSEHKPSVLTESRTFSRMMVRDYQFLLYLCGIREWMLRQER